MDQYEMQTEKAADEDTLDPRCLNCNVPMKKAEDFGTESDGSRSEQYCCHCMQGGNLF